eukprot:12486706-Prorocentrum_lima.AAC.1
MYCSVGWGLNMRPPPKTTRQTREIMAVWVETEGDLVALQGPLVCVFSLATSTELCIPRATPDPQ